MYQVFSFFSLIKSMNPMDVNNQNGKYVIYTVILFGSIALFRKANVGSGVIISIVIALFAIQKLQNISIKKDAEIHNKNIQEIIDKQCQKSEKIDFTMPKLRNNSDKYTEFIFFVQEFHEFNPIAFENMVDSIDDVLDIKMYIELNPKNVHQMWDIANNRKLDGINSLLSIQHALPNDIIIKTKLNNATYKLKTMLNEDMMSIYEIYKHDVSQGRDFNTKQIDIGPKPYNIIESQLYTYDYYID